MSLHPTPKQALLLFDLALRGGAALLEEMKGYEAAERRPLRAANFIEEKRVGRKIRLKAADHGWAWINAHLTSKLPPQQHLLELLLAKLAGRLEGLTFAEFLGPPPPELEPPSSKSAPSRKRTAKPKGKPKGKTEAAVRDQIESAYLAITNGRKDELAPLAELRRRLSHLDRATLDAALAGMLDSDPKARFMRNDDPGRISPSDREAEFNPHGEAFHFLWIVS